jgi:hypothetical protein
VRFIVATAVIVMGMTGLEIAGAVRDSQTNDEGAHLVSGYCEWTLHDFRLDPDYTPLAKLLQSLPLLVLDPSYRPPAPLWARADEFALGRDFLYRGDAPWRTMLLCARVVTVAFTAALAVLVAWWTRRRYGETAALIALLLLALDPTVLAHGHFATSDLPVTFFLFASWIAWDAWLRRPATVLLLAAGALAALAIGTKYSAVILIGVFPATWLLANPRPRIPLWRGLACLVVAPAFVILALYGFNTRSLAQDPILGGKVHSFLAGIPIPGYYFFRGFQMLYRFGHGGHLTYFLGAIRSHATPLYFPLAFLVKMPLATLAICAWAAFAVFSRRAQLDRGLQSLLGTAALIFAMGIASPLDIGFRHVMPMFPFLFIFCAAVISSLRGRARLAAAGSLVLLAAESLAYTPNFVPFFNLAAGGDRAGHRYLLDSNLDWGQDLNRLADWSAENHPRHLCLSYFGSVDLDAYLPGVTPLGNESEIASAGCDVAAISQENMYGIPGDLFRHLRARQPDAMAGTLYIYRLR